jgi:hypothetical protein
MCLMTKDEFESCMDSCSLDVDPLRGSRDAIAAINARMTTLQGSGLLGEDSRDEMDGLANLKDLLITVNSL